FLLFFQSRKCWIEEAFSRRECVKFIPSSWDQHRCCCGRLIGEHSWQDSLPPLSLCPGPGQDVEEEWSMERHTRASPTNAYGTVDFEDTATRSEALLQLMLREWQMERPKLLLSVHGGSENFTLPPKVNQSFSKGLITAALSTGAWIFTDGINTGVSKYVGDAVKSFGSHDLRKRNTVGITPWGVIDNNMDLIGRDVFRPYQPVGNPLSKRACLNGFHSHFLLVDDGTLGKHGCQQGLRRKLEKHVQLQKIHPRLNQGVPVVCVVVEGGPSVVSTVLDYVSTVPPVPVFVFEGSGRAADLLAFLHKQTAKNGHISPLTEATDLYTLLLQCMDHRQSITIFDSESDDQMAPDAAILTATLKGTKASPSEQLSMTLAWDRADIAQKDVLVYGQHWQVGSLEQAMLDALVMDRVSFVKMLIDNGMTMSRFLTVDRLEELYNMAQGPTARFLHHLVEDAKQTSLPAGYRLSIIDMGLVIEYLIGGAYRSTYTRKQFRAAYSRLHEKVNSSATFSKLRHGLMPSSTRNRSLQDLHFFRTAQPYKRKEQDVSPSTSEEVSTPGLDDAPLLVPFNFNDLFVWAVLQQRQQMALFLWQHGEEALARATVACKLYRSMAFEARQSSLDDNIIERFKTYSLEFGKLAVDVLDCAFRQNEQMAMKLLTYEMEEWSHFTCLQMAVSSCHRPFVSHSCTQTLLTDLWTGPLNMRKNSFLKIILSLLLPPAILLLEFKSKAEMCHVPQTHEAMLFGLDSVKSAPGTKGSDHTGSHDAEKGLSFQDKRVGPVSETMSSITVRCVSWITTLYDFYTAPVVKFWFHTMSYLAFLMLFSYVVLVKMEDQPSVPEWLVIAYILSTAAEKTREILMSEATKLSQKLKIWFSEYWNISDFIAILLFVAGLAMRWHSDPYRTAGRLTYCLDIIFWFIRVMDLLAVNQHAGPYLTMITKMTRNMFYIVVMMAIVLLSYGVSRKAVLSPDEEPSWSLARDIVFQPYWMIYGEVYASEIDPCEEDDSCPPASFLAPFLQAVYMFVQYIIMVNILIAFFNNVYFDMASTSNKLWKYNRYRYIMTYQVRPWLPPPLNLLSHMDLGLRAIYKKFSGDAEREERASGLKLYLGHEDRKKLHEFEEKCVEAYFHEKSECPLNSQKNRIKVTAERTEEMCMMVGEVSEKVNFIQDNLSELDSQLGHLQDLSALAVDTLTFLSASNNLHQEETRLAQCRLITASQHAIPHSWTLPHRSGADCDVANIQRLVAKPYKSTPPSLLKGYTLAGNRRESQECHVGVRGSRGGRYGHTGEPEERATEVLAVVFYHICLPVRKKHPWKRRMKKRHRKNCLIQTYTEPPAVLFCSTHETSQRFCLYCACVLTAVERNNLMRLAQTIPFTPVSIMGGEEVSIYSLEEVASDADPESSSVSSWSSRGLSAILQPLMSEEGSLDGGLRQGRRVLCTWAEQDVLRPGLVYVVKGFRPEVVRVCKKYFHGSTALQLCLREIQQQRAAQKMMQVFNQVKPDDLHHSPRFLDVSLVLWHSNGQWLTIERNMSGDFRKYNNNTGEEITPCCSLEEMLLAFSHWTYEYSRRELLVLDIQGVGEELTDPTVIMAEDQSVSRGEMLFGPDNLGDAGINGFLQKHSCSACCHRLGLKGQKHTNPCLLFCLIQCVTCRLAFHCMYLFLHMCAYMPLYVTSVSSLRRPAWLREKSPTTSNKDGTHEQPAN
uniref:non-specific serine/threonine protein kinase n=1 Tax=Oreochromis niloticus TaxID=8128 RepID=A0A669BEC2_ORENI